MGGGSHEHIWINSDRLQLEGALHIPDNPQTVSAVVVCHPHPLYGGTMDNRIVYAVCEKLKQKGVAALRFNFRGVGNSQGRYDGGVGEQRDVEAAVSFVESRFRQLEIEKIGVAGYSFGAAVGLSEAAKDNRVKVLAAISPPLNHFNFSFLEKCLKPKLLLCGSDDEIIPKDKFREFVEKLPEPKEYLIVEGADHFWFEFEEEVAECVSKFFSDRFK
jgi:alpha/beta superfamily hydrolase